MYDACGVFDDWPSETQRGAGLTGLNLFELHLRSRNLTTTFKAFINILKKLYFFFNSKSSINKVTCLIYKNQSYFYLGITMK